jgi:outer membrane protein assembly factor BamD (BamD/ComL family)/TM2 domain-containing membrane protein YozV
MADGEYYRAVTEYLRYLYLFPAAERAPYALLQIGLAHFRGGEYPRAIDYFTRVRATYSPEHFAAAAYHEGLCYERLNQPAKAQDAFERAAVFDTAAAPAREALLGKALGRVRQGDLAGGRAELDRFQALYPKEPRADSIVQAEALIDAQVAAPRKSPLLAGALSAVVPGSGQAYAGNYRDGLAALLVNGLFIAGTAVAIDQENYATAAVVGGVGLPFYLGNIYGAANAANKWNLALHRDLRDRLAVTLDYRY